MSKSPIFQFRVEPYGASRKNRHYLKSGFSPVMLPERIIEWSKVNFTAKLTPEI